MSIEMTLVILFAIATGVAVTARRFRIPYTVGLVLAGLLFGALHLVTPPHLTRELLFAVFNIDGDEVRRSWKTIGTLAVPGVVIAIILTGLGTAAAMRGMGGRGFGMPEGLVFGALVAATDPIAVVALFQRLHVPKRLATLVEGESLLNDGTSIVLLSLLLAQVAGHHSSWGWLALRFVVVTGGGVLVGVGFGILTSQVLSRIDDAMIEITITLIAAYGSFALAEQVGCSGVIATVVTGVLCGRAARGKAMSLTTRTAVDTFWEYLTFALNSVIFLLIGFAVHLPALTVVWAEIGVAYLIVLIARGAVVMMTAKALGRTREHIPMPWRTVMIWGGLRGALSMVLALALPLTIPDRELLITMTFGVVLLSILLQGLSMPWLLARLGVGNAPQGSAATPAHSANAA
jgi:CPA1 family monovalent cation:H+ antiporter